MAHTSQISYDLFHLNEAGEWNRMYKDLTKKLVISVLTVIFKQNPDQRNKWRLERVTKVVQTEEEIIPIFIGEKHPEYFRLKENFNSLNIGDVIYGYIDGDMITPYVAYDNIPVDLVEFVDILPDGKPDLTPEEWNNII